MPAFAVPLPPLPSPHVVFRAATTNGVLSVTRQDLRRGSVVGSTRREIARIPGMSNEERGATIPAQPLVSPDGTRLAVLALLGGNSSSVPPPTTGRNLRTRLAAQAIAPSHLLLILDARSGRIVSRSRFEGVPDYVWSATSRTLGIVARSRDARWSSVYVMKEGEARRLVRRGATTLFWAGDGLLTASWTRRGKPVSYGEMFQAFGARWRGCVPSIRSHARGQVMALDVSEAERRLGTFGLGARLWSPSPEVIGRPIKCARERSVLVEGGAVLLHEEEPQFDADGQRMIGFSTGPTRAVDTIFSGGKRYLIGHPGLKQGDGGQGRSLSWNLGRGCVAYVSDAGVFGGDEDRGELAAIDLRTGRKCYWNGLDLRDRADYDVLWR